MYDARRQRREQLCMMPTLRLLVIDRLHCQQAVLIVDRRWRSVCAAPFIGILPSNHNAWLDFESPAP
jgi:hypothetical protein